MILVCYTLFMNKINQIEERVDKGGWKHEQHTKGFVKEMNKPKEVQEPFRILDEVWKVGKFKGQRLDDTPEHYIRWILVNFNHLSKTHRSILENKLNKNE